MLIFLPYRLHFFFHRLKTQIDWQHGVLAAAFILTTYITFMTENSYYHFYTVLSISTLIMAYQYEYYTELEKEQRYKEDDI